MRSRARRLALFVLAIATLTMAEAASAQPRPCVPNGQPLPPGYGAPNAPPPCAPGFGPYGQPPPYRYGRPSYAPPPANPPTPGPQPCTSSCCERCCTPSCAGGRDDDDDDDSWLSVYFDLLSVRVGTYDIRGSDADKRTWGFLFSLDPDIVTTSGHVTHRTTFYGAIGGGSDGLEGQLDWGSRVGVRGYFGDVHGPFARAGMGLQLLGNNKLYRSHFELPMLEAGYQVHSEALLFELAATGGLILGGRYFTGDHAERRIDSEFEWGGQVTLQADHFRLAGRFMRIQAGQTGPGTPIDELTGQLCLNPIGVLLLCADGAWHRGDVALPGGRFSESTALYLGGTIGLGVVRTGSRGSLMD